MPFIHTRVNRPVTPEQEKRLAREYGRAIELLNKSEKWLMLQFDAQCRLYFRGDSQKPLAFVNVKALRGADGEAYNRLTGEICRILNDVLTIPGDGVYVEYDETDHWGWKGENF